MQDGQANENADAYQDLRTAMRGLGAGMAWGERTRTRANVKKA
jgi:hypothetical protein